MKNARQLKQICPMPVLLEKLGLGEYAQPSCCSPLRPDEHPSWGIFKFEGNWFWKDHGTGDSGDEITLLARINNLDTRRDFRQLMKIYENLVR